MSRILAIAHSTLAEAIRHRVLYLLLVFAAALMLFSRVLSMMTVGDDAKIIKDLGLSAISVLGLLVALFVGVGILFREMERRTVQVTLSAPVARWEYIFGKYLGLAATISINTAALGWLLVGMTLWRGAYTHSLLAAIFMLWVELMFITAAAVFFSSFSTPIFSALFTSAIYVVGHLCWALTLLEQKLPAGTWARKLVHGLYLVLPDLEFGDIRAFVVHGVPVGFDRIAWATIYELAWAGMLLLVAALAFRRRDLV
ncbi:MAG: ABC transporter permease subunit [Acidobacteriota bacterium]|nr:ABC transporter permease subunit [Acidobacteriota bacterium]